MNIIFCKNHVHELKKWSVILITCITGGAIQHANAMQGIRRFVHPDIVAFLVKEISRNTSLSHARIAELRFGQVDGNDPRDMQFHHPPGGYAFIAVPDLTEFFRPAESDRLIEISDDELSPELLTKKMMFRGALKHEEGHYYHNHSPSLPVPLGLISLGVVNQYELIPAVVMPALLYMIFKGTGYICERQADAYALRHIKDPHVLRVMGNDYLNTYANQSTKERVARLFVDEHPNAQSRGLHCLEAAERLERERKD